MQHKAGQVRSAVCVCVCVVWWWWWGGPEPRAQGNQVPPLAGMDASRQGQLCCGPRASPSSRRGFAALWGRSGSRES